MAKNLTTGLQRGLRQSIAGGLGTGDLFSTASLDLQFARHKSLDSRVTHTRQSSATYVDGDGVIRTAVTNLLLRSEEFDQAWTAQNGYSVTANQAIAPDGTLTADAVSRTNASSQFLYQIVPVSGTLTFSCWVKTASGTATFQLSSYNSTDGSKNSGDLTATTTWERFYFTITQSGATTNWYPCNGEADAIFYIWGAQLEESSTVGQYVKTTTAKNGAPRFDHDPETGESLGLLVEESRQNLLLYSTNFDNNYWLQTNITTNSVTAPDGTLTAATYEGTGAAQSVYNTTSATVTASAEYTYSLYVKLGTMSAGNYKFAVYDVSNSSFIGSDLVPDVTPTASSWTRITYSFTAPSGCTAIRVYPFRNSSSITSSTVHFWGAQIEAGSFPTSYIPTEGSEVERAADVASITGANFSSWYEQSEGTVFVNQTSLSTVPQDFATVCQFNDTTVTNLLWLRKRANFSEWAVGGESNLFMTRTINQPSVLSVAYKTDNTAFAAEGNLTSDSTCTIDPNKVEVLIGNGITSDSYLNGTIRRLTYWPTRLSDDTLQTITT